MPRELTDQQWAAVEAELQIAQAARAIWDDEKLGPAAKALFKEKNPTVAVPDYDIRKEMKDGFAAIEKRHQDERIAEQHKKEDEHWKQQRSKIQKDYGFTDDGIKDLEKFMLERNVGDYEVAATYHAARNPKPSEPSGYKDPYWNHGKSDTFQEIAKDPEGWGRNELLKALHNDQQRNRNAF